MKKFLLLFMLMFTFSGTLAIAAVTDPPVETVVVDTVAVDTVAVDEPAVTDAGELVTSISAIWAFFLPFILGQVLILLAEAKKHITSNNVDWAIFIQTNLKPFGVTLGGAIVIYLLLAWLPVLQPLLESATGVTFTIISATTLGAAATGIYKGFTAQTK